MLAEVRKEAASILGGGNSQCRGPTAGWPGVLEEPHGGQNVAGT